jgi:hypothetical protein
MLRRAVVLAAGIGLAGGAGAAPIAPGYVVNEIVLADVAAGDVVRIGDALFVGVGPGFAGGAQSVVRIDSGGATVVAQGFAGLGGFAYDAANDRLIVSDNALEAPGATTGDTVYAIPDPLGSFGSPVAAADIELLPSGTLGSVADLILDPGDPTGGTLLVSDAVLNQVLRVALATGVATPLQSTVGFAGGLAADATTLWFGEVTFDAFFNADGKVSSVSLPGTGPASELTTGLPGQYDLELAGDGQILSTSGPELVRIDPTDGSQTVLATGFGFATGLFEEDGVIWVLDGGFPGVARIYELVPIPEPSSLLFVGAGLGALALRHRSAS